MNLMAALIYWLIVLIWSTIVAAVGVFYFTNRRTFGTTRLLLAVLALDGLRNVIENIYFGTYFGSKFGIFPPWVGRELGDPRLLILPKIMNVFAGCIVMGLLILKWLPEAIREHANSERQVQIMYELATVDGMTGLKNRREFLARAESEWERYSRYGTSFSLILLDIDHFKAINDRFGHDIGDQVIIGVTRICAELKRTVDIAGRLGGEEFAILLPGTSLTGAYAFAERLRQRIEAEKFVGDQTTTVSIGVSEVVGSGSAAGLIKQSDIAMYEAKLGGRNRVCRFRVNAEGSVAPS